ncbi:MAG: hypothetical protein COA78_06680 [Blastopirellula sp.]|nr:MAG: hypothetical protein COA78_06680 [Blastopirellula sp.]
MARGKKINPAIIIIVIVLILFIIPTCICGGFFVVGLGTAVQMESMEQNARDEVQRMSEEIQDIESEAEAPSLENPSPQQLRIEVETSIEDEWKRLEEEFDLKSIPE